MLFNRKIYIERPIFEYDIVYCQFIENGNTITYATKLFKRIESLLPYSHAIFKIKLKDKRNFIQKLLDFGRHKKYWYRHGVCSQINK